MDPRIKKTKREIRLALVELLKEMPYEKITIKLISERAMVARPTFYAHYNTIQDILLDYLHDLFDTTAKAPNLPKELSEESLGMYFTWVMGLREIIDLMYKNNLEGIIYKLNRRYIYDKNFLQPEQLKGVSRDDRSYQKYIEYMGGILFAQVISLVENDWDIDVDYMAHNAYRTAKFIIEEIIYYYGIN